MKALLLKDLFVMSKQSRMILIIIAVFSVIPNSFISLFAVTYASMLPILALACDERSKWNVLAAMMPYSAKDIIMSKYVLGYLLVGAVAVIGLLIQIITSIMKGLPLDFAYIAALFSAFCIGTLLMAVNFPFMVKFGAEKGRFIFFILIGALVLGAVTFGEKLFVMLLSGEVNLYFSTFSVAIVTVIINIISIFSSIKLYNSKKY